MFIKQSDEGSLFAYSDYLSTYGSNDNVIIMHDKEIYG